MPWLSDDAKKHKHGLNRKSSEKWASIANSILAQTGDEGQAVRTANSRTGPSRTALKRRLSKGG